MKINFLKIILILFVLLTPVTSLGEILTIENVSVQKQSLRNGEFQIFIQFDLPELPEKANIDYAVLNMGMNVISNADSAAIVFEILSKDNSAKEKIVNYNSNPVTALIPHRVKGLTELELDLTELINLWVTENEQNNGVVLVSHRNIENKLLRSDKINLATEYKVPTLKIFYTKIE